MLVPLHPAARTPPMAAPLPPAIRMPARPAPTRVAAGPNVQAMAEQLAGYRPQDRAREQDAMLLLLQHGHSAAEIRDGLDAALALAAQGTVAAASDHPIARAIRLGRDLAAGFAILAAASGHSAGWPTC